MAERLAEGMPLDAATRRSSPMSRARSHVAVPRSSTA